jgi:hypothetical protein
MQELEKGFALRETIRDSQTVRQLEEGFWAFSCLAHETGEIVAAPLSFSPAF